MGVAMNLPNKIREFLLWVLLHGGTVDCGTVVHGWIEPGGVRNAGNCDALNAAFDSQYMEWVPVAEQTSDRGEMRITEAGLNFLQQEK